MQLPVSDSCSRQVLGMSCLGLSNQYSTEPMPLTQRHTIFFSLFQEEEDRPVPEGCSGNQTENADSVH